MGFWQLVPLLTATLLFVCYNNTPYSFCKFYGSSFGRNILNRDMAPQCNETCSIYIMVLFSILQIIHDSMIIRPFGAPSEARPEPQGLHFLSFLSLRRIFGRGFLRRNRDPPAAPIWCLPPEIFLLISDNLPPSDVAALSLTSKALFYFYGPECLHLKGEDRLKLLSRFQYRMPEHVLCYECAQFHHKSKLRRNLHPHCARRDGYLETAFSHIPFSGLKQIANRHLYGTHHHVSPRIMYTFHVNSHSTLPVWEIIEFRVGQGDILLLKQEIQLRIPRRITDTAPNPHFPFSLCPHHRHPFVLRLVQWDRARFECEVCLAAVKLRRSSTGGKKGGGGDVVDLTIWKVLGPCRSPREVQWGRLTTWLGTRGVRYPRAISASEMREVERRFNSSPPL